MIKRKWINKIRINHKKLLMAMLLSLCVHAPQVLSVSNDNAEVNIVLFEISPSKKGKSDQYTYHWKVLNSSRVRLFRDGKELLSRQSFLQGVNVGWDDEVSNISIKINKNTRYKLVAESSLGTSVNKTFSITKDNDSKMNKAKNGKLHLKRKAQVLRLKQKQKQKQSLQPKIHSFGITPSLPETGELITFHWDISNAQEVSLYDDYGKIDFRSDGPARNGINSWFSTTINKEARFRLEVLGINGKNISRKIQVKLRETGVCTISGKLEGLWKRKVQERFNGPLIEEEIPIYIRVVNENKVLAKALISSAGSYSMGRYHFKNLKSGKRYLLNSSWRISPKQVEVYCKKGANQEGPKFGIIK